MSITTNKGLQRSHCYSKSPEIAAAVFTLALLILELIVFFPHRQAEILQNHLQENAYFRIATVGAISLLSIALTYIYILFALRSRRIYRAIYFVVFSVFILSEYSVRHATGKFSNSDLLGIAVFAGDYSLVLQAAREYVSLIAVIPIVIFGLMLWRIKTDRNYGFVKFASLTIIFLSFFIASAVFTGNEYYTSSFAAGIRTSVDYPVAWYIGNKQHLPKRAAYIAPRIQIDIQQTTKPENNVVFIVDESVRGDHLSLNGYPVETTSLLEQLQQRGYLKNWGIAVSGGTCSVRSNNLLLTGLKVEPDSNFTVYRLPTIFQYARSMGYTTYRFDGQASMSWLGKSGDMDFVDHNVLPGEIPVDTKWNIDAAIAEQVNQIVSQSTGNFFWINKAGVHKPYTDHYPSQPGERTDSNWSTIYDSSDSRDALMQSYDKAVSYNSQLFFGALFPELTPKPNTIYVYTSDHGQTLMENGATLSHCSDTKPEANVPLFIIADSRYMPGIDTNFEASHANIFATLLDLMNVPISERKYDYAASLLHASAADNKPRFYFAGDISDNPGIVNFDASIP